MAFRTPRKKLYNKRNASPNSADRPTKWHHNNDNYYSQENFSQDLREAGETNDIQHYVDGIIEMLNADGTDQLMDLRFWDRVVFALRDLQSQAEAHDQAWAESLSEA